MARKASINFKPVANINFAISHSERTELSEPGYLLPKEHRLPNIVVAGSLSEKDLVALFLNRKESMSRQAKRAGASPFFEGVAVLKNTNGQEQSEYLLEWRKAYEKATGHRILHMAIHLDEGFLDRQGKPHYNPHAHIIVDRMNEKNRFIHLGRKQLSEVQDLTANILEMDRGSTLDERRGRRGRKHIPHDVYRDLANGHRLEIEIETNLKNDYANWLDYKNKEYDLEKKKIKEANKLIAEKDAEIAQLKAEYAAEREALKASGEATQGRDEATGKVAQQATEIERLKAEYAAERAQLKASGTATQQDYQQLKASHEAALAELTASKAQAAKVPNLVEQLKGAQQEAINTKLTADERYKELHGQALKIQAARNELAAAEKRLQDAVEKLTQRVIAAEDKAERLEKQLAQPVQSQPAPAQAKANAQAQANAQAPTLAERLAESLKSLMDWIKGQRGSYREINTDDSHCIGPVLHLDDLHAVQRVGHSTYTIHRLDRLDKTPVLDVPATEIKYADGRGTVAGLGYRRGLGR